VTTGESLAGQTVEAARRALTARFKSANIDSAELDARMLVGAVLGLDLTGMITVAERLLTSGEALGLADFTRRRLAGEPVAQAVDEAAAAAEAGMRSTIPLQARKGRASYLGERSVGHQDPGATSTALILRALQRAVTSKS